MSETALRLTREPEYFKDPNQDLLIEVYSFDSSRSENLFRLGNGYITVNNFKLEIQKGITDNIITSIFITLLKVPKENILKIADFFESNETQIADLSKMEMADIIFSIYAEVVDQVIQNYYDNVVKGNSLQLFSLLDKDKEPALLNFKYYKPEVVFKV